MLLLENTIRRYAWGSDHAITDLLGIGEYISPQAELWIGAHPSAPSTITTTREPLDECIAASPVSMLGRRVSRKFDNELPLLMKVLAADTPLSLQVHPTTDQARAGFDAENAAGVPIDAPNRNYKDPHHKPEIIVALTPFAALSGFRNPQDTRADLQALLGDDAAAAELSQLLDADPATALHDALTYLLSGDPAIPELVAHLTAAAGRTDLPASVAPAADTLRFTSQYYPGDPGVAATLLLNRINLDPGEALFLDAGNIHAYLHGVGIEVMAASDNVLRGGLTPKHIDVPELQRVVRWEPVEPPFVHPEVVTRPGGIAINTYRPGAAEFEVSHLIFAPNANFDLGELPSASLLLVTHGDLAISRAVEGAPATPYALSRGTSAYARPGEPMRGVAGKLGAELWIASVPRIQ